MSLKAKLEAVIYAAEEPVTLNQLAALFAADALEWKAAREAAAAEQTAEVAGVSPDAAEALVLIEVPGPSEQATEGSAPPPSSDGVISVGKDEGYQAIVLGQPSGQENPPESGEPAEEPPSADAESEAKRLARQRDREVKAVL